MLGVNFRLKISLTQKHCIVLASSAWLSQDGIPLVLALKGILAVCISIFLSITLVLLGLFSEAVFSSFPSLSFHCFISVTGFSFSPSHVGFVWFASHGNGLHLAVSCQFQNSWVFQETTNLSEMELLNVINIFKDECPSNVHVCRILHASVCMFEEGLLKFI